MLRMDLYISAGGQTKTQDGLGRCCKATSGMSPHIELCSLRGPRPVCTPGWTGGWVVDWTALLQTGFLPRPGASRVLLVVTTVVTGWVTTTLNLAMGVTW